jgi:sphingolipid delta-4 desaturase
MSPPPSRSASFGRNPWTALYIFAAVAVQLAIAWLMQDAAWWVILLAGWSVGALISHLAFCLYHECTHNLVFPKKSQNHMLGLLANLPLLVPSYASFSIYHLKHHQYQGDYRLDADMATAWEARLIGHSMAGKILWEVFYPFFRRRGRSGSRARDKDPVLDRVADREHRGADALPRRALSLPGSPERSSTCSRASFSRWDSIRSVRAGSRSLHRQRPAGDLHSYYGPMNRLAANIGYHNEHHDFPFVPWNRLPALKAMAPEVYDRLHSYGAGSSSGSASSPTATSPLFSRVARDGLLNRTRQAMPKSSTPPRPSTKRRKGDLTGDFPQTSASRRCAGWDPAASAWCSGLRAASAAARRIEDAPARRGRKRSTGSSRSSARSWTSAHPNLAALYADVGGRGVVLHDGADPRSQLPRRHRPVPFARRRCAR